MKRMIFLCLAVAATTSAFAQGASSQPAGETPEPPRAARSVHLHYAPLATPPYTAEASLTVTETQTNSYFMAIGWDAGYCGLQDLDSGNRIVIFSVWDPSDPFDFSAKEGDVPEEDRAKVLYSAPNVYVSRFGHEGTGAKTMAVINWEVGEKVSFRITCEEDGDKRLKYSCYVTKPGFDWERLATISTIVHGKAREAGLGRITSFVEDFRRDGASAKVSRRAEYRDVRTKGRGEDAEWIYAYAAKFTADKTPTTNVDAGALDDGKGFFLKTGGDTKNEHVPLWGVIRLDKDKVDKDKVQ